MGEAVEQTSDNAGFSKEQIQAAFERKLHDVESEFGCVDLARLIKLDDNVSETLEMLEIEPDELIDVLKENTSKIKALDITVETNTTFLDLTVLILSHQRGVELQQNNTRDRLRATTKRGTFKIPKGSLTNQPVEAF